MNFVNLDVLLLLFLAFLLLKLIAALLLFLELVDLFSLVGGHAQCSTIVLCLIKNLSDKLLALPDELLLALVRNVQIMVNLLILLLEGLKVLVLQVFAQELGELLLNALEFFLREAEGIYFLGLLDLEVVGLVVDASIVHIVVHLFSLFNSKNNNCPFFET